MIMTPSSFTYENLSSMKFKELQKLSTQFHVNKRWAKKQELIENLLALKKQEKALSDNNEEGENWRDGSTVFGEAQQSNEKIDRRFTFSINTKSNVEQKESHLTFEVCQNGKDLLNDTGDMHGASLSMSDLGVEPLTESRATFDIPIKTKLLDKVDPRATFDVPQTGKKLLEDNETSEKNARKCKKSSEINVADDCGLKENLGKVKFDIKDTKEGKEGKEKTQVKTLTVPYAKVTRRTRKNETSKTDSTPIKMSKKSINIKKTTRLPVSKGNLIKSPAVKNSINKQTIIQTLTKPQPGKLTQSKVPVRLKLNEGKSTNEENKENNKKILRKRLSKTADETLVKKSGLIKVSFRTPPTSVSTNTKLMQLKKTPMRKEAEVKGNSNTGVKSVTKPLTINKMPDFTKIHKRQFEQMDSLHDYLKKKEERIKKLFGTPQPGQQLGMLNKSLPVFRFESRGVGAGAGDKENKGNQLLPKLTTPLKKKDTLTVESKTVQKETYKSKLPPSLLRTDIKDKNRSHIHGVRTNKRFELQMKFRNM